MGSETYFLAELLRMRPKAVTSPQAHRIASRDDRGSARGCQRSSPRAPKTADTRSNKVPSRIERTTKPRKEKVLKLL